MKIALITDAWFPQVNGVVRALSTTADELRGRGYEVEVIHPGLFRNWPCPTYPEIRLAPGSGGQVRRTLDAMQPDAIHIATEGPLGWAARGWCLKRGRKFTTSFHTRFPDYVSLRTGIPADWIWPIMRRFHRPAERTFVVTRALGEELEQHGIKRTHLWPLGVDLKQFNPSGPPHPAMRDLPRPIMLNVGRVAIEKNIEAFLDCPTPGTKVVVGDGPALEEFRARYPQTLFLGALHGEELASAYRAANVFVFPSLTDTFGLVNIEALACGLAVAAFAAPGPLDIIGEGGRGVHGGQRRIGALNQDLARAIRQALTADRVAASAEAKHYRWARCTDLFLEGLAVDVPIETSARSQAA